jgi:hypothetical protein
MFCARIAHFEERREVYHGREMVAHFAIAGGSFSRADEFETRLRFVAAPEVDPSVAIPGLAIAVTAGVLLWERIRRRSK